MKTQNSIKTGLPLILLAFGLTAHAGEILKDLQGKWKVDVAATKASPEGKAALASEDPLGAAFAKQLFDQFETYVYEFKEDKYIHHFKMEDMEVSSEMLFKVVENTDDKLVIEVKAPPMKVYEGGKLVEERNLEQDPTTTYVYRQGEGFVMRDSPQGEPPVNMIPIVLMR